MDQDKKAAAGDVVEILRDGNGMRKWVILEVTEADIEAGTDAVAPGLHAFGGMWYGDEALSINSYGKMISIDGATVLGRAEDYTLEELKALTD